MYQATDYQGIFPSCPIVVQIAPRPTPTPPPFQQSPNNHRGQRYAPVNETTSVQNLLAHSSNAGHSVYSPAFIPERFRPVPNHDRGILSQKNFGQLLHGEPGASPRNSQPRVRQEVKLNMRVGPNRFGRKGTIRCERCRSWRKKVTDRLSYLL